MKEMFSIDGKTDEELIAEYSIEIDGRTFVPARLLDAIGERQVRAADRKPGDPGTVENPIFKKGKAYVYGKRNKLILWEDYAGPIPSSEDEYLSKGTEAIYAYCGDATNRSSEKNGAEGKANACCYHNGLSSNSV